MNATAIISERAATTERMTIEQFMQREISRWGEDEILALLDRGYAVVPADNQSGWSWQA